jgi:hypothetical protein
MYISIKVFRGDDEHTALYESDSAYDIVSAEEAIGRIGRHIEADVRGGKILVCADCGNIISRGSRSVGEDEVEVEEGHNAECSKVTALV